MSTQLIRARKKPRFGLPWVAIIVGASTLVFAMLGIRAVAPIPEARVEIIVQGQNPLNISQATVDAAITEPIRAWKPLSILVTDRLLSYDELQGRVDPGVDVILSTAITAGTGNEGFEQRFTGAGIYPAAANTDRNTEHRFAIHGAYMNNVGLGHGPEAVAAAAQRAAEVLDDGPIRSPVFWLAGTTLGLALTMLLLAYSLSRRKRRQALYGRLTTAQRQLAGVVLELEALEITYRSAPEERRTPGFTAAWNTLSDASLALARTEEAVIDAVHDAKTSLRPATSTLVEKFEAEARALVAKADALMGAGSVLGRLAGSQRVLDRLAAPLVFISKELLARLHAGDPGTVWPKRLNRLERAVGTLLDVLDTDQETTAALEAWSRAEVELQRSALAVNRSLRRHRQARVRGNPGNREDFSSLRTSLGLSPTGSRETLYALDDANAAARALLGPLPGSNETGTTSRAQHRWRMGSPYPRQRGLWITGGIVILMSSLIISGAVLEKTTAGPAWMLSGSLPPRSLVFDGDLEGLSESAIRGHAQDKFTQDVDITIAVRSAGDYLGLYPNPNPDVAGANMGQDPQVLVDALWRLKAEFPELLNHATGELRTDQVIVPVWRLDDGTFTIPTLLTGAVSLGDNFSLGNHAWDLGSYIIYGHGEIQVANSIEDLARGLQGNGFIEPDVNDGLLFWLLTSSIALGLVTLVQMISYGGAISLKLGRFGRNSSSLRRVRKELESLALGLDDSRLNAVAVLGAGSSAVPAESDQRIFERGMAMAWRMADDLAARPLSQRLGADYIAETKKLEYLVTRLGIRDMDAARRTRELLDTALRGNKVGGPHQ